MQRAIGWNGLSRPTKGCSVCMPIVIINFKARGAKQDSVPYMVKVVLTCIPINPTLNVKTTFPVVILFSLRGLIRGYLIREVHLI